MISLETMCRGSQCDLTSFAGGGGCRMICFSSTAKLSCDLNSSVSFVVDIATQISPMLPLT